MIFRVSGVDVYSDQAGYDLRCEWGLQGMLALAPTSDAVVIVDVLSFSTAVDIAVSLGASVLPYRWKDESAERFAIEQQALLASDRDSTGQISLSPTSLRSIPARTLLVLPSPNGSTLSLSTNGVPTFTACLRNAPTVARRVAKYGSRISVIPAGERWGDGSLRPCLEDSLGAGAVLAELPGTLSSEAELAVSAFMHFRGTMRDAILRCGSGKELIERGFVEDVELAAEYDVSSAVPILHGDRYIDDGVAALLPRGQGKDHPLG